MKKTVLHDDGRWRRAQIPLQTKPDDALIAFFSRPYFSRVWVVQEALLAPSNICICGTTEVPFICVVRVAVWLYRYHLYHIPYSLYENSGLQNASRLWIHMRLDNVTVSSADILYEFSKRDCTDHKDKIFGLLGVMNLPLEGVPQLLKPSYTKPVSHVYRDAVRYTLQMDRTLELLGFISHRSEDELSSDFPSWVPRLDRKRDVGNDHLTLLRGRKDSSSEDMRFAQVPDNGNPQELILRGMVIDQIETAYPIFQVEYISSFWQMVFELIDRGNEYKRRFAMVLTAGTNHLRQKVTQEDLDLFNDWRIHVGSNSDESPLGFSNIAPNMPQSLQRAMKFQQAVLNATGCRRFAITKAEKYALVPRLAKEGDTVTLMNGGLCPIVLRLSEQREKWQMLGECYLEDNMEGEAWEQRLEEVQFCIR